MPRRSLEDLGQALRRIDGRGYKAYRDLRGEWDGRGVMLALDRIQGDPFAAPSLARIRFDAHEARIPPALHASRVRRVALEDLLARRARGAIAELVKGERGSGKSGTVRCDAGGQTVLERTAARVTDEFAELRLEVGLPAAGRRVLAREAEPLLCDELVRVGERALRFDAEIAAEAERFVACIENQEHLRAELARNGWLAFVGDGAVLPRRSGVDDRPATGDDVVPFDSPASLRVTLALPNPIGGDDGPREIRGMAVRAGVTLIVGGGYHGKSTLLAAIEAGVHPHVPGDGREYVVSRPDLVKIRAEDGRRVARVDIRGFIGTLPGGRTTEAFASEDASGSTSQAASIVEAVELGTSGLLLDEDTCATNFMVRDARMQALVAREDEPITPFLERVRELHERLGVSTVLVMGGVGDYFAVADHVIRMSDYRPADVTAQARAIAAEQGPAPSGSAAEALRGPVGRVPDRRSIDASRGRRDVRIEARARDTLSFGREEIDLRALEQIADRSQTRAIGHALHRIATDFLAPERSLREALAALDAAIDRDGLGLLSGRSDGSHPGNLARPRTQEIGAALNRLRTLRIRAGRDG